MPKATLTDARVRALKPRKRVRDIRDGKLRGFGVRVMPSGRKRFFVHSQHRGERIWRIVGDAATMGVSEARSRAVGMLAAIRRGESTLLRPDGTLFEAVAETVFERRERVWKARTMYVNRCYLRNQILPHFAGRPIAEIDGRDVRSWFASLRATPVAADRAMPVLSGIMKEAEAMGLREDGSNPCRGIRRYRRKGRERFLSDSEIRPLSAILSTHAGCLQRSVPLMRANPCISYHGPPCPASETTNCRSRPWYSVYVRKVVSNRPSKVVPWWKENEFMSRANASGYYLTDKDVPIVMGMIDRGDRKHDIAAWFGVNQGRIAEAEDGRYRSGSTAAPRKLPPKGPPGVKGRHLRESVETAVDRYDDGEIDLKMLLGELRDALAKYDSHEA